jgi:hypothetical protein
MNIKIEGPLMHKGRESGLYQYHYTDRHGEKMSPTFQGTMRFLEREMRLYSKAEGRAA